MSTVQSKGKFGRPSWSILTAALTNAGAVCWSKKMQLGSMLPCFANQDATLLPSCWMKETLVQKYLILLRISET